MGGIFISYRREDSADVCGRIYDHLVARYGKATVFKDVDSIPYGANFPEFIQTKLAECSVCLVVIGPRWLNSVSADGRHRLDDPSDLVRVEIETALARGLGMIPVLVNGAPIPSAEMLPKPLARLHTLNAAQVREDPDFTTDVGRLGDAIERYVSMPRLGPSQPQAVSPASDAPSLVAAPATPARTVGPQSTPSPTAKGRRISPRLVVVGVLLLAAIVGSVALLPQLGPSANNGYDVTGTWQLLEAPNGGQRINHTLVLHRKDATEFTGTISASLGISLPLTGTIEGQSIHWLVQDTSTSPIICSADFAATLSDSTHIVQGTISPTTNAGQCTDFSIQFPVDSTFSATKTG
jgi:hypothetical protein